MYTTNIWNYSKLQMDISLLTWILSNKHTVNNNYVFIAVHVVVYIGI